MYIKSDFYKILTLYRDRMSELPDMNSKLQGKSGNYLLYFKLCGGTKIFRTARIARYIHNSKYVYIPWWGKVI